MKRIKTTFFTALPGVLAALAAAEEPPVQVSRVIYNFPAEEVRYMGEDGDGNPSFSGFAPIEIVLDNEGLGDIIVSGIDELKVVDSKGNDLIGKYPATAMTRLATVRIQTVFPSRGAWVTVKGVLKGYRLGAEMETDTYPLNLDEGAEFPMGAYTAKVGRSPELQNLICVQVNFPAELLANLNLTTEDGDYLDVGKCYCTYVGDSISSFFQLEDELDAEQLQNLRVSLSYYPVPEEVAIPFSFRISMNGVQYPKKKNPKPSTPEKS